jgi:hypothetical protein
MMLLLLLALPLLAAEWAKTDGSGRVVQVIVAEEEAIRARKDGPWVKTPSKVGKGYTFKAGVFSAPAASASSVSVSSDTPTGP